MVLISLSKDKSDLKGSDATMLDGLTALNLKNESSVHKTYSEINSLNEERQLTTFPIRQMTYYLDGGPEMTMIREKIMLQFERDPDFRIDDYHELTRAQLRERIMKRANTVAYFLTNEPVPLSRLRLNYLSLIDPSNMTRFGVHYGLFLGAVSNSGTPEQVAYWLGKGATTMGGLIGCFAMTEMGHGSNVAGLETVAIFDEEADEFIIHTPTLTATKWWIGGASETATHACVFAQMIIKDKNYGVKSFIVQLRNPQTFDFCPGISIGDCGAKMGRNGIDNGWIQFTNVRIPRSHLLMRHTKVSRNGEVTEPPLAQLTYGALILGRVTIIKESADIAKKALIIAIRYSATRRQFSALPGSMETKILDYKTHHDRLFPILAGTFAIHFGAVEVTHIFDKLMSKLEVAKSGDNSMNDAIESLKETHATAAGLKAYSSWYALETIERSRQACGGHGYSSYAGLSAMFQDFAVQCTWEGDNTVLTLQAGRYLVQCYLALKKGKKMVSGVSYLNNMSEYLKSSCPIIKSFDIKSISVGYDVVRCHMIKQLGEKFTSLIKQGKSEDVAFEEISIERFKAAQIHCIGYLFQRFSDGISNAPNELRPVLLRLCLLYGLCNIQEHAGIFLQYKYLQSEHIDIMQNQIFQLYEQLRPDAVSLVDSFNFTDYIVNSPFGRYDGDTYRQLFQTVVRQNPPCKPAYFDSILKPLLNPNKNDIDEEILQLEETQ